MSEIEASSNDQSALVCLPDDVLIRILGQLSLKTQLMMAQLHTRFLALMPHVWRSQGGNVDFSAIELPLSDKVLRCFLENKQQALEVLNLPHRYILDVFTDYVFPNLHDLTLGTVSVRFGGACMLKVTKSFPYLRSFTAHGVCTGKHFDKFTQLESLTLTDYKAFDTRCLLRILSTCRLKTLKLGIFTEKQADAVSLPFEGIQFLEVIRCNSWEIKWFSKHLNNLAHLKQVILTDFADEDMIEDVIMAVDQKTIKCIEFNGSDAIDSLEIINNLETDIQTIKMSAHSIYYGELNCDAIKELYLKSCTILYEEFFEIFLHSFKIPEILGLDSCTFLFREWTFDAHQIGKGRRTKLHIYLYNNACLDDSDKISLDINDSKKCPMKWQLKGEHRFLEMHMEEKLSITYSTEECSLLFD